MYELALSIDNYFVSQNSNAIILHFNNENEHELMIKSAWLYHKTVSSYTVCQMTNCYQ